MVPFEGSNTNRNIYAAPRSTEALGAHLKCLYTSAWTMRNKQDELEVSILSYSYDIIGISETWWDETQHWTAGKESCRLLRKDRTGEGFALYISEKLDCIVLAIWDDLVENL